MKKEDKQHVTLTDLSKKLNLSIATVSSVLNNKSATRRIPEATSKRVLEEARKIGYIANISARRLKTHGANAHPVIIALITSVEAPSYLIEEMTRAVKNVSQEPEFAEIDYSLIVELYKAEKLSELPGILSCDHFNAAIISNTLEEDEKFLENHPISVPTVLVGRDIPNYSFVKELNEDVGRQAAKVLYATGSTRPVFLRPRLLTQTTKERISGFTKEYVNLLKKEPVEIIAEGFSNGNSFDAVQKLILSGKKFDGLFSVMDSLVMGAYHAIKINGLQIPSDITVIGSGNFEPAPYLDPPLSTFVDSGYDMHQESARILLRQIQGKNTATPTKILIPAIPFLRESTGRGEIPPIPHFNNKMH